MFGTASPALRCEKNTYAVPLEIKFLQETVFRKPESGRALCILLLFAFSVNNGQQL